MANIFSGTGVALVTPFRNGAVDFDGLQRVIDYVMEGGVEFVVSLGTTGETAVLSPKEQIEILDFTVKQVNKRVKVVAGFAGNNTAKVVEAIQNYHFEGVDGILSASPHYNKPTQEGIYQHFMAIAAVAPRPIILYNVPGRTASNMTAETTLRLANASTKFVAIKEASGNLGQCMSIAKFKPPHFALLSGDDNLTLPMMAIGAEGLISVAANAFPREVSEMVRLANHSQFALAKSLHFSLQDLTDLLFVDGNPAGVKGVLEVLGICSQEVRLPLVPVTEKTLAALKKEMASLQMITI